MLDVLLSIKSFLSVVSLLCFVCVALEKEKKSFFLAFRVLVWIDGLTLSYTKYPPSNLLV